MGALSVGRALAYLLYELVLAKDHRRDAKSARDRKVIRAAAPPGDSRLNWTNPQFAPSLRNRYGFPADHLSFARHKLYSRREPFYSGVIPGRRGEFPSLALFPVSGVRQFFQR